ncbi:hypothetical protein NQ314_017777 [Rhamnusium bicolor]|uniref:DEUBAD domain-containing protein n=1 Tax=Rhamnusium bicolor TaxID=1586634 RepID=A0AAV8WSI2_9CUCU|nr:hypothetical protein NQ314_017777 [Rhamnusium bicolor]
MEKSTFNILGESLATKSLENLKSGSCGSSSFNILEDSKAGLGSYTSDNQKTSVPLKTSLKYNILENPQENLGAYVDNTQTELLNLQDMLNNLSSNELSAFFNIMENSEPNNFKESRDLANFCESIQNEDMDNSLGNGKYGTKKNDR